MSGISLKLVIISKFIVDITISVKHFLITNHDP